MRETNTLSHGSILSFPDRGPWGNSRYRGNCSGHVYKRIFEHLRPRVFTDPMVGSGTSVEVAREMGIEAYGLDLHSGFNILKDSILKSVGKPSDLVLSHPPYHDMIPYSGSEWGREPHPDDLSRCGSEEEFLEKLEGAIENQRTATAPGGYYGIVIGDVRRRGQYSSYQAEAIARMPKEELRSVLIKAQHNMVSSQVRYAPMKFPKIMHEYVVLWQRLPSPGERPGRKVRPLRRDIPDEEILELAVSVVKSRMNRGEVLGNPEDTKRYLVLEMCRLQHEVFSCLFLDSKHRVLGFDRLFTGTIDGATVHPREVVKKALQYNAAAVILAHNHPSGVSEPSRADELITGRLKEALALVDIRVLDHIIIGGCDTVSLAERGVL